MYQVYTLTPVLHFRNSAQKPVDSGAGREVVPRSARGLADLDRDTLCKNTERIFIGHIISDKHGRRFASA